MHDGWIAVAEGDDVCAVAVGFLGAYTRHGAKFGERGGTRDDEVVKDAVAEDYERGFAGFSGFGFAPAAEMGFEGSLVDGVGCRRLVAFGFEGGFGWFGGG